jgi:hypothetical protein
MKYVKPQELTLVNGVGAAVLVPLGSKVRAANEPRLVPPSAGALDAWWRVDDLWRRVSTQVPTRASPTRRQVTWSQIERLPSEEARALARLSTYRWCDGDRWASVARMIIAEPSTVTVTLIDDARLLTLPEGAFVRPHLEALLAWLTYGPAAGAEGP